jgi:DNA repair protein RecO (recombination protein O)
VNRTYKVTGINLKAVPMGESDRLLTILTPEVGLIRAVAMGARKHNSSLGGRSGLFVVNELLVAKGRSLDKIAQAETVESYPGLGQDLQKLTASQYLAELTLFQALSDQPQEELFTLLNAHLKRLEQSPPELILPYLTHGIFQLLSLAGVAPQVHVCCITRQPLSPDFATPDWRAGFNAQVGGVVTLEALDKLKRESVKKVGVQSANPKGNLGEGVATYPAAPAAGYGSDRGRQSQSSHILTATELVLLQQVAQVESADPNTKQNIESGGHNAVPSEGVWQRIEYILRHYAQYHFDRQIRSATLIDACFCLPSRF